jgi:MFS family permease
MNTAEPIQPGAEAPAGGSWLTTLDRNEKRTLAASFSGYAVDSFDYYTLPLVTPILIAMWGMSKTEVGVIGTATLVASALGGWLAGILADRYGRVRILQLTILVFAVFTFACGLAQTPGQLLIARTLQGLGFGGEWAVGSVLIAEMIRPAYRGKAVGLVQSSWAVGWGAAVLVSMALFSFLPPEISWRVMFLLGCCRRC